jgi:hypothetical protein
MSCQRCQQKTLDCLATGHPLPQEVRVHRDSCAVCREFHLEQQALFHAIDAGLHSIANQPIPPSFLPGLRIRLEANPGRSRISVQGWSLAFLTTALILALFGAFAARRFSPEFQPADSAAIVPQTHVTRASPIEPSSRPPAPSVRGRTKSIARSSQPRSTQPEVIVLAEERRAFAKYLAAAPEKADVPLMPTSPVQPVSDDSQEIALLKIDSLAVPPLQGAVDK